MDMLASGKITYSTNKQRSIKKFTLLSDLYYDIKTNNTLASTISIKLSRDINTSPWAVLSTAVESQGLLV